MNKNIKKNSFQYCLTILINFIICNEQFNLFFISSMSEVQQMISVIKNILQSHDTTQIAANEQSLLEFSTSNPLAYVSTLMEVLKTNESKQIKSFAILRIEKQLVKLCSTKQWANISSQQQNYIRTSLFELVKVQTEDSVRGLLAVAIGEVAGQLMLANVKNWPKFEEQLYSFLKDGSDQGLFIALKILNSFLNYSSHVYDNRGDELYVLFKNAFSHKSNKIKEIAIKSYCGFLATANKKALAKMETLMVPFFEVTYHLIVNDNMNIEGLELISDLAEVFPRLLKNSFTHLSNLFDRIASIKQLGSGPKRIVTQTLLTLAEHYPELFKQSTTKLNALVEMVFLHMIDMDENISDEWKNPPQGYSEDFEKGDDFEATNFGTLCIDRLISYIGDTEMVPLISITIQKMLQVEDWRYKFASLMALSEVGEHIPDIDDLKSVVEMEWAYLSHPNPMIRFAALHSLGQTADDQKPEFQLVYGKDTFLKIAPLLRDPVPRVVSHAASSLSNVIDGMPYEEIEEHVAELMNALLILSTTGISLVKTSVMTTISAIAMVAKQKFVPYFEKTSQILFSIIQHHNTKQYKELKGFTVEALTTIAHAIGKQAFKGPAEQLLIEYLIRVQENQNEEIDPPKQYLLEAWQKLCVTLGRDLEPYLPRILPGLITIVERIVERHVKHSMIENILTEEKGKESKINTYETEEAESALAMLNIFIQQTKELFIPYAERASAIMLVVVKSQINENVKLQALIGLPAIVSIMRSSNLGSGIAYAKNFLSILINACHHTEDSDLLSEEVECMEEIFKCFEGDRFLQAAELTEFSKQVVQLLSKSKERRSANDKEKEEIDDIEKTEIKYYAHKLNSEEEVQVALSNLIGEILKTHKEMNLGLVQYVLETELPRVFVEGATSKMIKFGIFLVDDMIDHLGYEIMKSQWNDFGKVFIKYLMHGNCAIRQSACYGLGIFAEKTPSEIFQPHIQMSLDLLLKANSIEKSPKDTDKAHRACTDNIVSSIGKIIKSHGKCFDPRPYLAAWLKCLPLKIDEVEAVKQHQFLSEITVNDLTLLVPDESQQSISALSKILNVFGEVAKTKLSNEQTNANIKATLNKFKALPVFNSNSNRLWANLSQKQAKKLVNLAKS